MTTIDHITNGEVTVPCGGKPRTFKFGMLASRLLASQVDKLETNYDLVAVTLWAGLMVRSSVNELPADFSPDTALEWADDMAEDDLATVLAVSEKSAQREKNVNGRVNGLLGRDQDGNPIGTNSKSKPTKSA